MIIPDLSLITLRGGTWHWRCTDIHRKVSFIGYVG
jgi:hypothetical protein